MVATRAARLRLALSTLAMMAALTSCDAMHKAQEAKRGADRARQCATLVADLAGIDLHLSPGSAVRSAGKAEEAARKLNDRAQKIDQADVKNAAETLADRLQQLSDTAATSTPAQREQAVRAVTQAATTLASTCDVPLDQLIDTS